MENAKDFDNRPIGIFDSGVGGLTVVKEVRALLPNEDIVYFGDTARVPYGGKSVSVIRRFSSEIAAFLEKKQVKMLVVACNTASALALDFLRRKTTIPVIGVIDPGVRAAIKAAGEGSVGVIGTRATISSGAYQDRIKRLQNGTNVIAKPCPLLVPLVEENLLLSDITRSTLQMYLEELKTHPVSSLILACTHYPLLKPLIAEYFGSNVVLIDSATETALEVKEMLHARRIKASPEKNGREVFYVSDSPESFKEIGEAFLGRKMEGGCFQHIWHQDE